MSEVGFKHMNISDLHQVLADKSHVVVDIRDPASFQSGRIPGALHLTNDNISDFVREADLDAPLVVCCYHGHSSQQAAQFLASQDFTDVYSLDGGFVAWQQSYPETVETA
ncbi:thiosulfate sulfurtransferase [Thalassotalea sp. PP2-459]|nr:thiosulfate sulfurtransferase [Thalassotalea sp. PP2-459]